MRCRAVPLQWLALLLLVLALAAANGPPPTQLVLSSRCGQPPVNDQCFADEKQPGPDACCGESPPEACWADHRTHRRCCPSAALPAPPECDDGDLRFLEVVSEYFQTGAPPSELGAPSVEALRAELRADAWDDEVDRCPAAVLSWLFVSAELLAALGKDALDVAAHAYTLAQVLQGAAIARGSLSRSGHRYPASAVSQAMNRARVAIVMHAKPQSSLSYLVDIAHTDQKQTLGASCLYDMHAFDRCLAFQRRAGTDPLTMLALLRSAPHADALAALGLEDGRYAILIAQLHGAAKLHGILSSVSGALLQRAAAGIRGLLRQPRPPGSARHGGLCRPLARALSLLRVALANGTAAGYSEAGKEGLLAEVLDRVGAGSKFFVEVGVGDGKECNTRHLRQHEGWRGIMLDQKFSNPGIGLHRRFVTAANVNRLLEDLGVPRDFDLLSLDVDGNDFWLWRALDERFRPRVVVVEYVTGPGEEDVVSRYAPSGLNFASQTPRHVPLLGASQSAMLALARAKEYRLAALVEGYDLIFARADLLPEALAAAPGALPREPAVGKLLAHGGFHITSSEALSKPTAETAVHPSWTAACLDEAMQAFCDDPEVGRLCWPSE